ncbi:MAG TPA: SOS response-associated peptidase [Geobacteraceae bacterium]|nr:SOS response-associated peptidase [Geobacteraceae bacterium]
MCGRFTLHLPREILEEIFGVLVMRDLPRRYNIAPGQNAAVIRVYPDGTRHLDLLRWGLVPSWAKNPAVGSRMINARSETAREKPAFRNALKYRRCIVPASGFYEWREEAGRKKPLYLKLKDDKPMMFAGLWEHWKSTAGDTLESFAILTTGANELIKPVHDRMPLILDREDAELWLDPHVTVPERLDAVFKEFPSEKMEMYPVSKTVNSAKNDGPECIRPVLADIAAEA